MSRVHAVLPRSSRGAGSSTLFVPGYEATCRLGTTGSVIRIKRLRRNQEAGHSSPSSSFQGRFHPRNRRGNAILHHPLLKIRFGDTAQTPGGDFQFEGWLTYRVNNDPCIVKEALRFLFFALFQPGKGKIPPARVLYYNRKNPDTSIKIKVGFFLFYFNDWSKKEKLQGLSNKNRPVPLRRPGYFYSIS